VTRAVVGGGAARRKVKIDLLELFGLFVILGGVVGSVARAVADAKADGRTTPDEVLAVVRVALVAGMDKLAPALVKALED